MAVKRLIPKAFRNQYDQAIRSVGVRIIEVGDAAEYEAALGANSRWRMVRNFESREVKWRFAAAFDGLN